MTGVVLGRGQARQRDPVGRKLYIDHPILLPRRVQVARGCNGLAAAPLGHTPPEVSQRIAGPQPQGMAVVGNRVRVSMLFQVNETATIEGLGEVGFQRDGAIAISVRGRQ